MRAARDPALRILGIIATIVVAGGCATSGVLDVGYQATTPMTFGPAPTPPPRIAIRPVVDQRVDPTRVGLPSKKSGQNVVTRRPVVDIVHEALVVEFRRSGYALVSDRSDVAVAAQVEEFWLDVVNGYKRVQYVGRVAIALTVIDGRGSGRLLVRRYVGIARREADQDIERAGRAVLDAALARTIHDAATDPTVLAALAVAP